MQSIEFDHGELLAVQKTINNRLENMDWFLFSPYEEKLLKSFLDKINKAIEDNQNDNSQVPNN